MIAKLSGLALMAVLVGCASVQQVDYYTLDMTSSGRVDAAITLLDVDVRPGEAVAKREIMIRVSPTEIEYYALHRWAADLSEQLSEKLKAEFGQPAPGDAWASIKGDLLAFEQVDTPEGADARVKMDLRIGLNDFDGKGSKTYTKVYEVVTHADAATPGAVVRALSSGVETIAAEIAADLADELRKAVQ